ncbi:MAG: hypothetical protein GWO78_02820 [Dehalococcoidales bacterium]|jgi:hypothetical protein|nr:hypothetical protein [Dehalococcoidia bacterium]NCG34914.1 hypothetical protein [Dehalococcoidales bacterium]
MASGEITYKTLKQAKIAYAIAGWSIDLEEENLVIVSKQKKSSHIIHAIVTLLTGFLWTPFWIAIVLRKSESRKVITFHEETKTVNIQDR